MNSDYQQFKNTVMEYYGEHGRHNLPWRKQQSPYYVAVSEIMLQQTQVDRVIPFFKNWMKQFPSWSALSHAPQSEVLRAWKGLGYNSRALRLQKLAQVVTHEYKGRLPKDFDQLLKLPGIGPYTAGAIRAFAFNLYTPLIDPLSKNSGSIRERRFYQANKKRYYLIIKKEDLSFLSQIFYFLFMRLQAVF